jgi:hypothetical protein
MHSQHMFNECIAKTGLKVKLFRLLTSSSVTQIAKDERRSEESNQVAQVEPQCPPTLAIEYL